MTSVERYFETAKADVCIVGAGPVGLALAFKLEELGLTVLLVEMGGEAARSGVIEFKNSHHAPTMAMSRPGIGGASALWGGRCVAFDDLDFEKRDHVPFSGWPFPHEEMSRHYREALSFLKSSPVEPSFGEIPSFDTAVTTLAIEQWSRNPNLGPIYADRLGSSRLIKLVHGTVTDILLDTSGEHVERLTVKRGEDEAHVTAGRFVLAGGGLENARLMLAMRERQSNRCNPEEGPLGRFYQGHLTGYIAVIKFDRAETAKHFLFQKDEAGYVFRRRLQIAPAVQEDRQLLNCVFWIDAISIADPVHGSGALSLIYLFLRALGLYKRLSNGLAPTAKGLKNIDRRGHWRNILSDRRAAIDLAGSVRNILQRRTARWRMLLNPAGRYLLRYHAEQVPNPDSRVVLNPAGTGNALMVDYKVVDQDLDSVLKSHDLLDAWLKRNGLGRLEYLHMPEARRSAVLNQAFDGYHQIGLARMAETPEHGVTDADCRVHGIGNLYLAGSSLFPTGGHANPTLPAVALALRLAEHLKRVFDRREA